MIQSLSIRNFQRHRSLDLKLDPRVTTIVGPSDTGKSAIIRALTWVLTNKPRGAEFLRDGAKQVSVSIKVGKHQVKRSRGKGNHYFLNGKRFSAFGNEVPKEIAQILNISPLNFQGQHDPSFWFSLSPGDVSKQLNAIVDLSLIDTTLANLASSMRKAKAEKGVVLERLSSARKERKNHLPFDSAHRDLSRVERLEKESTETCLRRSRLNALLQEGLRLQGEVKTLTTASLEGRRVLSLGNRWRKTRDSQGTLRDLVEKGTPLERGIKVPSLVSIEKSAETWTRARMRVEGLRELLSSAEKDNSKVLSQARSQLEREMGDTCPLCESPVNPSHPF